MEGYRDQEQSQRPHDGATHHKHLAAQPVGEARQEGGEDHLADGLSGADQPDGRPVGMSVRQVGEVELHRHGGPRRRHPDQSGAGEEGRNRGLAGFAELVFQVGDEVRARGRAGDDTGVGGMALSALCHDRGPPPGSAVRAIARVPPAITVRRSLTRQFWRQGARRGRTPATNPGGSRPAISPRPPAAPCRGGRGTVEGRQRLPPGPPRVTALGSRLPIRAQGPYNAVTTPGTVRHSWPVRP